MSRALTLVFACSIVLATTGSAHAQYGSPPPPPPGGYGYGPGVAPAPGYAAPATGIVRSGFIIGFSLGGGSFNCDECSDEDALSGLGLDIHLGGMVGPRLAIMFDGWGVNHSLEGGGSFIHVIDAAALQLWVTPSLWVKGGLGIGQLSVNDEDGNTVAESDTGGAVLLAAGLEVYQGRSFALDLQLRAGAAAYEDVTISMGTLSLGFNWY